MHLRDVRNWRRLAFHRGTVMLLTLQLFFARIGLWYSRKAEQDYRNAIRRYAFALLDPDLDPRRRIEFERALSLYSDLLEREISIGHKHECFLLTHGAAL